MSIRMLGIEGIRGTAAPTREKAPRPWQQLLWKCHLWQRPLWQQPLWQQPLRQQPLWQQPLWQQPLPLCEQALWQGPLWERLRRECLSLLAKPRLQVGCAARTAHFGSLRPQDRAHDTGHDTPNPASPTSHFVIPAKARIQPSAPASAGTDGPKRMGSHTTPSRGQALHGNDGEAVGERFPQNPPAQRNRMDQPAAYSIPALLRALTLSALLASPLATAQDQRDLDGISIIGNQELPRSLVIVPWKRAELGEATLTPSSGLLDEGLQPIDPTVFRRELNNYEALRKPN